MAKSRSIRRTGQTATRSRSEVVLELKPKNVSRSRSKKQGPKLGNDRKNLSLVLHTAKRPDISSVGSAYMLKNIIYNIY